MGIFDRASLRLRVSPWHLLCIVFIIGFFAGGLLDLDHIPFALGIQIGYVPFEYGGTGGIHQGRLLHGIALVGGGAMCACAGGFILGLVLRNYINRNEAWLPVIYKKVAMSEAIQK